MTKQKELEAKLEWVRSELKWASDMTNDKVREFYPAVSDALNMFHDAVSNLCDVVHELVIEEKTVTPAHSPELIEKVVRGIMENYPEAGTGMALQCHYWDYKRAVFKFMEYTEGEGEDKEHVLDLPKLMAAFPLLLSDKWPKGCTTPPGSFMWEMWAEWLGQADAFDFDAFVQLAILGEVIYG